MTDIAPAPVPPPSPMPPPMPVRATTPPPTFGPQWPGPGRIAPPAVLVSIIVVAVAAAAMVGWDRPGIGWFATGLVATIVIAVAVVQARRQRQEPAPSPEVAPSQEVTPAKAATDPVAIKAATDPVATKDAAPSQDGVTEKQDDGTRNQDVIRVLWAVLALALLSAGALRAAEWLWVLCLPTALFCGVLAVTGGRTVRGVVLGTVVTPIAAIMGIAWVSRGFAAVRGRSGSSAVRIAVSIALSLALLFIFGGLFASADVVFDTVLDSFMPEINGGTVARWLWNALFFGVATLAACYLAVRPPSFDPVRSTVEPRRVGRIEWAVPVGTLVLLFAGFVAVQATVLFGGADHVLSTAGLTYAEYARQGFWQLLGVTVLTLLVLAVAAQLAPRATAADRIWLRALLGALAVLTLVIVASAISRMLAYQDAYGFTRLRVLVIVCEGWLGLVFILVLLAGIRLRAPWLARSVIATGALALVGIVAANPDYLIAQQNMDRYARIGRVDLSYLSSLSADAVPALDRLSEDERVCVLRPIAKNLADMGPDEWFEWNLGRQEARNTLAADNPPVLEITDKACFDILRRGTA